ncbi:MAG: transketolase [Planctomycetaceae bacterium]|jgi:transketolase|nr:transketolase [Planctomycetaceae bacterium]
MTFSMTLSEKKAVDTIRTLSMEAVQQANSGHPGTPMALAPLGYFLFNEVLKYDPADPAWFGRDRFVLSVGHASMLIYSLLHLSGVKQLDAQRKPTPEPAVSLDAIKNFRQLGSRCAGHPEYGHVSGVEVTTGPLGSGVAASVGMAIAAQWFAGRYNSSTHKLFDSNVFAVCGDGDMMEGVTAEAASFAGHLKLSNLCWFYDDNKITIEGSTDLAFTEDVGKRFEAYGWNVLRVDDVNDLPALRQTVEIFRKTEDRPTLVIVKSQIGFGSPKLAGSHEAHGAPLGEDEVKATKKVYGFDPDKKFVVEPEVYQIFADGIGQRGAKLRAEWNKQFEEYRQQFREQAEELTKIAAGELPDNWNTELKPFPADPKGMASRVSSGKVLNQLASKLPWILGGSADLAPSNKSDLTFLGAGEFSLETPAGRNFHYGIREHAMGAITNGLTLSGLRAYCATFFVFADYLRPAIRLSALMKIPAMYIFTHDSIGVGEDGPTHQPIEHLASLRAIPNVAVFRPADANEVSEAYKAAVQLKATPSVLVFTRQNLPTIDRTKFGSAEGTAQGAYILAKEIGISVPQIILLATGSEVGLCLDVWEKLTAEGIKTRVVSIPCFELFDRQPVEYRNEVLPPTVKKRIGVELGIEQGWRKYLGDNGIFLGMTDFGASAPAGVLMKHFGFTAENLYHLAKQILSEL